MKGFLIGFGVFATVVIMVSAFFFMNYVNATNYGAKMDASVKAQHQNCKQVLAQYGNKVQEIAQVPAMYAEDFKALISGAMEGKYGSDGAKAAFLWANDQNIVFDASLYKQIQVTIAAGRDHFENEQKKLLDIKRQYEGEINSFWSGMFLRWAGFPKVGLDTYNIVTSGRSEDAFKTGKEEAMKLR